MNSICCLDGAKLASEVEEPCAEPAGDPGNRSCLEAGTCWEADLWALSMPCRDLGSAAGGQQSLGVSW